jgi:hypothetical protein
MPLIIDFIFEELEKEKFVLAGDGWSKFGRKLFCLMVFYYSSKLKK